MRVNLVAIAAILVLSTSLPSLASDDDANCGNISSQKWMSLEAIKSKATELGYNVRKVEHDDGCYEVYAIDRSGTRVELYMNPATGEIVKTKRKS